jgi:hypothetical protein
MKGAAAPIHFATRGGRCAAWGRWAGGGSARPGGGGGGSGGGTRRPRLGQAGPNGWMSRAGKEKFRKKKKKDQWVAREFWAGLILGYDEKKKKIFGFWLKEWYSNLKFKYLQTKFELDF